MTFQVTPSNFDALAQRTFAELAEAERCAEQASRRRARIREEILLPDLRARYRESQLTEPFVNSLLDKRAGVDPYWKSKASANSWHLNQAQAFGTAALVAAERERRGESA